MERMNTLASVLIILGAICTQVAFAAQHVVGGSQGWDPSTDFSSWASGETFKVGDQLVFKYSSGLHSVVELGSESEYKSCDVGSAVNSMTSGNDLVKLSKSGTRYFACGTSGHCDQGMKVKISVVSGNAPSSPASTSSSPTTTSAAASVLVSRTPCSAVLTVSLVIILILHSMF